MIYLCATWLLIAIVRIVYTHYRTHQFSKVWFTALQHLVPLYMSGHTDSHLSTSKQQSRSLSTYFIMFTYYTYFMFVQGLADAEETSVEVEDCSSIWTAAIHTHTHIHTSGHHVNEDVGRDL